MASDVEVVPLKIDLDDPSADQLSNEVFEADPFYEVEPSLLSATDIVAYVEKTALINPFTASRKMLKHASYEGKIGKKAYTYDGHSRVDLKLTEDHFLKIPANSIVFVESDVTFRLPRYIAARFNLQIKHVHRGLLLGTGPLIDPGFRGRLLIPLHNLTSEDYYIHRDDGLIWIEFTKTTFDETRPEPYGDFPEHNQISDGTKWLDKAAYCKHRHRTVAIRSSILPAVEVANTNAKKALTIARTVKNVGYVGGLALLLTFALIMLGEIYTNRSFMLATYGNVADKDKDKTMLQGVITDVRHFSQDIDKFRLSQEATIDGMIKRITVLENEAIELRRSATERPRNR